MGLCIEIYEALKVNGDLQLKMWDSNYLRQVPCLIIGFRARRIGFSSYAAFESSTQFYVHTNAREPQYSIICTKKNYNDINMFRYCYELFHII